MSLQFSKKELLITIVSLLLLGALFYGAYSFYVSPKLANLEMKEKTLKSEQALLEAVSAQSKDSEEMTFENTVELQKRVPVKPLTEKFVLDIQKAEVVSNSFVMNVSFADGELKAETNTDQTKQADTNKQQEQTQTNNQADQKQEKQTQTTDNKDEKTTPSNVANTIPMPTGMKKITATLEIQSPNYESLEKFIQTLEDLQRIVVVEGIDFSGKDEVTSVEQQGTLLTYTLTVSSFYMPTLTDLQKDAPSIDVPEPGKKKNPLSRFPDLKDNTTSN